jgi:hypothetical protein
MTFKGYMRNIEAKTALGHGHAMAIYALLKGVKTEHDD